MLRKLDIGIGLATSTLWIWLGWVAFTEGLDTTTQVFACGFLAFGITGVTLGKLVKRA